MMSLDLTKVNCSLRDRDEGIHVMFRGFWLPAPQTAICVSALVFGAAHALSPYNHYVTNFSAKSYALLGISLLSLASAPVCAAFFARREGSTGRPDMGKLIEILKAPAVSSALRIFFCLCVMGAALKCYDLVVARKEVFLADADVNEKYRENAEVRTSLYGVIGTLFHPLCLPIALVLAVRKRIGIPVRRYGITMCVLVAIALLPTFNSLLIGKRGAIVSVAALAVLFVQYIKGRCFSRRELVIGSACICLLFLLLSSVLAYRLECKGDSMEDAALTATYTHLMTPSSTAMWLSRNIPESLEGIFYDYVVLSGYMTHSIPEYLYLVEQHRAEDSLYGRATFGLVGKFLSYCGVCSYDSRDIEGMFPRPYVYTTLFGPLYLDFGEMSVVVSFMIGLALVISHRVAMHNIFFVPLYFCLFLVVLWAPMISFLYLFYGFNYMCAFVLFAGGMQVTTRGLDGGNRRVREPRTRRKAIDSLPTETVGGEAGSASGRNLKKREELQHAGFHDRGERRLAEGPTDVRLPPHTSGGAFRHRTCGLMCLRRKGQVVSRRGPHE